MSEDQFMGNLYQRFPVTIEKGVGAHVWDIDGKEYIDCMGGYGVALVGHQNQRVNKAIKEQLDKIITVHSSLYNKTREEFLKILIGLAPKGLTQVHLNNSGAEAIEAAIKFARKFTGKKGMVAMKGSYHGKSFGALSLTFGPKYRKPFEPLVEKVSFASFGDIESLRSVIDDDTAFVILEPIQGESGIIVAPEGFLQEVRKLCDEKGILLIFDEIQAGLGRTGRLWACDHWNTAPDILCLAKGIAGGVPMGVTLVRPDILSSMSKGEHSSEGLEKLKEKHTMIREIRGKGLMIGIEMKFEIKDILMGLIKEGILMLYSGRNILRILPPLVISEEDITKVLHALDSILTEEEQKRNVQG